MQEDADTILILTDLFPLELALTFISNTSNLSRFSSNKKESFLHSPCWDYTNHTGMVDLHLCGVKDVSIHGDAIS